MVKCDAGGEFSLGGLAAGTYGIKYTTTGAFDVDLPDQTIDPGQPVLTGDSPGRRAHGLRPADDVRPGAPFRPGEPRRQRSIAIARDRDMVGLDGQYRRRRLQDLSRRAQVGFSPTTSFEDATVEAGASYVYEVRAYDTAGNESPLSPALTVTMPPSNVSTEVLGYWKFDEGQGGTAVDSSFYDHHGTIFGAAWAQGYIGQALDFDGTDDYVQLQPAMVLDNMEALTITAWIYPRVDAHWHVLDKGDGDKRLYSEGNNRSLDGRIRYEGAHAYSKSLDNTVRLNEWQHVALVWSRATNTTRLYHNGVEVRYATQDIGTGSPLDDTTHPWTIGARGNLGSVTFFNGLIDEVRLYRRALAASEIGSLYGSPAVRR